jgi:hypothetical protein
MFLSECYNGSHLLSGGCEMASVDSSSVAFVKEYQDRFEKKMKEHEIELLEHWKGQLEKIENSRPDSIASLLLQLRKMSEMMSNRIKVLKKG